MNADVQDRPATPTAPPAARAGKGLLLPALAILFALAIQVQATLPLGASAVRTNLADLVAAPLALWALVTMLARPNEALRALTLPVVAALAAVTLAFTIALMIGMANGGLTAWAAVKYAGWFALVAYLIASFGLGRFAGASASKAFALTLAFSLALSALVQLVLMLAGSGIFSCFGVRFCALAGNPNAAALVFTAGFVFAFAMMTPAAGSRLKAALILAGALNLAGIVLTGSLAALIALPVVFLALLALRVSWRRLAAVAVLAVICLLPTRIAFDEGGMRLSYDSSHLSFGATENKVGALLGEDDGSGVYEITVGARIESLKRGLAEWREAPLFGIGLGSHMRQAAARGETKNPAMQIHNTPVWLLAETGLAGFLSVAALIVTLVWALAGRTGESGSRWRIEGSLPLAAMVILGATLIMSMAHEFMYQRIVWAVIGLALGAGQLREKGRAQTARP